MEEMKSISKELYLDVPQALDRLLELVESKAYQQLEKEDKSESYFDSSAPSLKKMRIDDSKSKSEGRKIGLWRVNFDSEERRVLDRKGEIQLSVFLEN